MVSTDSALSSLRNASAIPATSIPAAQAARVATKVAAGVFSRLDRRLTDTQLRRGLGWFSLGVGLIALATPRALSRFVGAEHHPLLTRMCGLREVASGVGLLSRRAPKSWALSRIAGDSMDLSLLQAAARSPYARRGRILLAAAAIVGITALDVYAAQRLRGGTRLKH